MLFLSLRRLRVTSTIGHATIHDPDGTDEIEDMGNRLVSANDDHTDLRMREPGTSIPDVSGVATRLSPSESSTLANRLALPPYPNPKEPSEPVLESAGPWRMGACRIRGLATTSASR